MAHATPEFYAIQSSSPITTLRFSQQAPVILKHQLHSEKNPISAIIAKQESPEKYGVIEQLFFSCLQTGDDRSALLCLEQLTCRFGSSNEKVMGLRGLYEEAIAENQSDLEDSLRKYDSYLSENPLNLPILKRRVALLRSLSRPADAITGLVELLKAVPTDAEAWCELADLYQSQGLSSQAIFSLEEALLIAPNAWNIHARLGEVLYICARTAGTEVSSRYLQRSIQYFCRSVELCDDYLRGFYGLVLATSLQLKREYTMGFAQASSSASTDDFLPKEKADKLNLLARRKLEDIVKQRSGNRQLWEHAQGELIAAQELLDRNLC
ncbi:putative oca3 protein [Aspergillus nomiae NRRL 13137]|uniref:ER membrane protein complex subunit 2 n=1 Tax=Aspergillus nomiae NRRL (strain ATCC 15546 / NRRL 13137 / CBS 260.88 / M93) TaxID=1509407 RepID=A0A0L1IKE8_ASPN3|nr:putative oca3 protein [Aspergillus nomiae NRRL 13137]KNG80066.1 putative oca3 protein [Aspergillus nomiae NRRL 13137]